MAEIAADLDALSADDFDLWNEDASGIEKLDLLTEELLKSEQPKLAADLMLHFMERLDESDLGAPGPLVHTLEKLPGYEVNLFESVARKPTPLSLWMINRILNVTTEDDRRRHLITIFQESLSHQLASDETRQQAEDFLKYHGEV